MVAVSGTVVDFSLGEFSSMTGRSEFIEGEIGLADHDGIDEVGSFKSS